MSDTGHNRVSVTGAEFVTVTRPIRPTAGHQSVLTHVPTTKWSEATEIMLELAQDQV